MTVEEVEIIVTAKVEEALKEFEKMLPAIKKAMKEAQEAFSKVDTKTMTKKLNQAVNFMKKKMQDLKKSSENNEIAIKVNNKDAQKQITQLEKEIDSLQKKITGRQLKLDITNNTLDKIRNDTNQSVIKEMPDAGNKKIKQETYNKLNNDTNYNSLVNQSDKLNKEIEKYNELLNTAKAKMAELEQQTSQTATTQNKMSSFFSVFKQKVEQVKPSISNMNNAFKGLPKITQKITNNIKGMGKGLKNGLGHVLKYAGALFSLRGIYSTLSSSANSWLSSQNAQAKQLSTNIDYLKYSMGSVFAPIIQYVTNLVYSLMKAVQSLVYAFSGVNIFAKATASSMKSASGSASKASKSLAGIHNEINNVSDNDSSGGSGNTSPSMDLSQVDTEMSSLSQKLYDFFKPLVDSWNTYGSGLIEQLKVTASQIVELISAVWGSFENIITNGTVYSILENILAIIGNIAEAFSNAWNYNGNGDAIIQNLANALNNLLGAIDNVVQSQGFQDWLNNCSDKFRTISEKLSEIDWQPLIDALTDIGETIGTTALDILNGLVDIFKWLVENPIVLEIILGIAVAIGVVSTAISILSAVIALIIVAIINWDNIMNWLKQTVEIVINAVVEFFTNLWNQISFIFEAIWEVISTILNFIWNLVATVFEAIWNIVSPILNAIWSIISTIFQAIWNIISSILTSIWNIFSQVFNWVWQLISKVFQGIWNIISPIINKIWETIKFVLGKIQEIWSTVWNTISSVVNKVWNGIWNGIKSVINSILGGIESFVNGTIKGINKLLSGISSVANAVGSLIGLDPINLQINTISLPRLAKGGVLTEATAVVAGEYSGAKSNPEIVTPQNIMRDTFEDVLSDFNGNNGQPLHVTIQYLGKEIFDDTIDYINSKTRRTGKNTIVTVDN